MTDERHRPHGAAQVPDEQPMPAAPDPAQDPNLPAGSASRWLVPAGILGAVAIVLYVIAFTTDQIVLPLVGIVWAVALWAVMFVSGRRESDSAGRGRRLTLLLAVMAVGIVLAFVGIYLVATLGTA
ncbi:hypothetical protein H9651_01090 [Microbacterium sp. Sa4CUA7]|uniref:Uncharacterized protein n=1 Tax=Microbacterium pullorum TaxID=2762236 RepID=A0ABR8RYA6_9MICO|nr:hypothetical protein [Microbacterium pullorum]MBD7956231.1 hypothetical protein [Microbacterium pullorum]